MDQLTRIAALLSRLNWLQPQMGEFLGLTQASVSRMASGQAETGPVEKLLDQLAIERGWSDLTAEGYRHAAVVSGAAAKPKDAA